MSKDQSQGPVTNIITDKPTTIVVHAYPDGWKDPFLAGFGLVSGGFAALFTIFCAALFIWWALS